MPGHIGDAQNQLVLNLGQQVEIVRTHHLFRQVVREIFILRLAQVFVEVFLGLDQLQHHRVVDWVDERLVATLAHQHRRRPHPQPQKRLPGYRVAGAAAALPRPALDRPARQARLAARLLGQPLHEARKPHQRNRALQPLGLPRKHERINVALCILRVRPATHSLTVRRALRSAHIELPAKMPQNIG
ncbi:Uncharacterised protein [Bordetella pertussis]|nr:Uncharacterised protein [Bordetella pertussis]